MVTLNITKDRITGERSPMIYGHFLEHFHRQVYDGIFDPGNPLSDEDGMRIDIIDAMKKIKVPVMRWPGGCFVSAYHWKNAVGRDRKPYFDKAWRVEEPCTFGTDEYIKMCRKIGCSPYICTNAGTGSAEEMSDWVEYCNLETEGRFAKWRIENGFTAPHAVKYWSIGNENYGWWEIGAKSADEWGLLVKEAAKMIKHVDPTTELSAAALSDMDWNMNLLKNCGPFLDWISIHEYWDMMPEKHDPATYEQCMAFTDHIDHQVDEIRGILKAMKLDGKIKIAFDEWNLRSWHHPNVLSLVQGVGKETYVTPRDKNDINSTYTMADAVFTACFLNAMNRNCDIVGMANFAPILNTRGCIYSHKDGIVLRSTYHVFDLFVNHLGDRVIDSWMPEGGPKLHVTAKDGTEKTIDALDMLATSFSDREEIAVSIVNKDPDELHEVEIRVPGFGGKAVLYTLNGASKDSYNDIDREDVKISTAEPGNADEKIIVRAEPHSVNVLELIPASERK